MFRVFKVIGSVGTFYSVIKKRTYEGFGRYEDVYDAYRRAKELNRIYYGE